MTARKGGYATYWAARSRLLLDGAVSVDAIGASRIPAGWHVVEVIRVEGVGPGRRATLRATGGRTATVPLDVPLGARLRVLVEYAESARLLRTTEGSVVAAVGGEVVDEYATVGEARREHPPAAPRVVKWRSAK